MRYWVGGKEPRFMRLCPDKDTAEKVALERLAQGYKHVTINGAPFEPEDTNAQGS